MLVNIEHECDDGLMLQLTFEYRRGYQEVRYLSNGDPGYPGEPDEIDLVEVRFIDDKTGKPYDEKWADWPAKWMFAMEEMHRDEIIEAAFEREDY